MASLGPRQGVTSAAVVHIPLQWDPVWFRGFITMFMQNADVRNAQAGGGVQITGQIQTPGQVNLSGINLSQLAPISGDSVIGNPTNVTATPTAIVGSGDKAVLHQSGSSLSFSLVDHSYISDFTAAVVGNGGALDSIGNVQGDILYRAAGTSGWTTLGPGTANQVLTTGGGAANPAWTGVSTLLDLFGSARGDVLYRGASGWAALPPGTAGQLLTTGGVGADPTWTTGGGGGGGGSDAALASAILTDTPFAYWKCNDASTKFADSSGNGFDLTTINGSVNFQASSLITSGTKYAYIGTGISSTASGASVVSALGRTFPFTTWTAEFVAMWLTGADTTRIIDIRNSGSVIISFTITSGAGFTLQTALNATVTSLATWTVGGVPLHVVVTCSTSAGTSTFNVYVNGKLISRAVTAAASTTTGTPTVCIGELPGISNTASFVVGNVALYASVLSVARIQAHAIAGGFMPS